MLGFFDMDMEHARQVKIVRDIVSRHAIDPREVLNRARWWLRTCHGPHATGNMLLWTSAFEYVRNDLDSRL